MVGSALAPVFMTRRQIGHNSTVVKSNALARSGYSASVESQRLLAFALAELCARSESGPIVTEEDLTVQFPVRALRDVFPSMARSKTIYERLKNKRDELTGFKVDIVDDQKQTFRTWVLITYAEYSGGTFMIRFNPQMKEHLTGMKRDFLAYKLMSIAELETAHEQHLYEILRSYLFMKRWEVSYEDLRKRLGLDGTARYELVGNFKKDVLAGFIARANAKTDINVSVEDVKDGKKIAGFIFHLAPNERHRALEQEFSEPQVRLLDELKGYGVNIVVAQKLVLSHPVGYIQEKIAAAKQEQAAGRIKKSFTGWLLTALRDGYQTLTEEQKTAAARKGRIDAIISKYEEAAEATRGMILTEFLRTISGNAVGTFYEQEGLNHPLVRNTMAGFLKTVGPRFGLVFNAEE